MTTRLEEIHEAAAALRMSEVEKIHLAIALLSEATDATYPEAVASDVLNTVEHYTGNSRLVTAYQNASVTPEYMADLAPTTTG